MQNDFLTFACATGANVLTQSAYAAASATATGYVSGTASSTAVNKTLRQTSIMSGMIASFIVDKAGTDVIDDGTLTTIQANFVTAIANVAGNRIIQITDVVGLTTALNGKLNTTGNAASASKLITARTITLGGAATGSGSFDGSTNITINTSIADGSLSIAKTGGLQTALDAKAPLSSPALTGSPTAPTQVYSDATTKLATTAFVQAAIAAMVSGSTGLIELDGFKLQYGSDTCPASYTQQALRAVTFPTAYQAPPKVFLIAKTNSQSSGPVVCYLNANETAAGFVAAFDVAEGSGGSTGINNPVPFNWFAIGY